MKTAGLRLVVRTAAGDSGTGEVVLTSRSVISSVLVSTCRRIVGRRVRQLLPGPRPAAPTPPGTTAGRSSAAAYSSIMKRLPRRCEDDDPIIGCRSSRRTVVCRILGEGPLCGRARACPGNAPPSRQGSTRAARNVTITRTQPGAGAEATSEQEAKDVHAEHGETRRRAASGTEPGETHRSLQRVVKLRSPTYCGTGRSCHPGCSRAADGRGAKGRGKKREDRTRDERRRGERAARHRHRPAPSESSRASRHDRGAPQPVGRVRSRQPPYPDCSDYVFGRSRGSCPATTSGPSRCTAVRHAR